MSQELEAYLDALQSTVRQHEDNVGALQASVDEVARVKQLITQLPEKVRHKAMVPYGKHAFFEGELIHTNEFLVGLGCDLSLEASASQAAALLGRRQARGEAALASARAKLADLRAKAEELALGMANEEGEAFMEIRQDYEESEELLAAAAAARSRPAVGMPAANKMNESADLAAGEARSSSTRGAAAFGDAAEGVTEPAAAGGRRGSDGGSGSGCRGGGGGDSKEDEDARIFARLAELELLEAEAEAEAGSDTGEGAGGSDWDRGNTGPAAARKEGTEGEGAAAGNSRSASAKSAPSSSAFPAGACRANGTTSVSGGGGPVAAQDATQPTPAAGAAASKQKAAPAFKKGFLLGPAAGGGAGAKRNKGAVAAPEAPEASLAGPGAGAGPCSQDQSRGAAAGSVPGSNSILRNGGAAACDAIGEEGNGTRTDRASSAGAGGDGDAGGPRRRRVSFADGSIPGEADDLPGPHEHHRFPSPPAVSPRRLASAGPSNMRPALKQSSGVQTAEREQAASDRAGAPGGMAAGRVEARAVGRLAGLGDEGGDAAMAMARAREAAFSGVVRERVVEEAVVGHAGSGTPTVVESPAAAGLGTGEEQAAPRRMSKFKQQRMGVA